MDKTIIVNQLLRAKKQGFHAVVPDIIAYDALEIMAEKNVGALLVVENGKLMGVFSERDYARKVILKGKASKSTTVRELMSSPPIVISPEASLQNCMVLLTQKHIRHLPVVDNGVLIGVVSIGDVVNAIISEQNVVIEQLKDYIGGNEYKT